MDVIFSLYPFFLDWLDLIVRWIHIVVGIAWIGTSFYFNWLDSRLDRTTSKEDLEGELWSVHSGGFYNINKLKGPPKKFPKELHWFKWEAYTTWISGFVLLIIVYYLNAEGLLIDKNINDISPTSTSLHVYHSKDSVRPQPGEQSLDMYGYSFALVVLQ